LCNTSDPNCLIAAQAVLGCQSAIGQSGCTGIVGQQADYVLPRATQDGVSGNPITQYRASQNMIINGTSVGHELHDGYVVRWIATDSAGDVRIWTYGRGVNASANYRRFNYYGGKAIFHGIGVLNAVSVKSVLDKISQFGR
jgi:hypothetical protein